MNPSYAEIDAATLAECTKRNGECICARQRRHVNPMCKDCSELRERVKAVLEQGAGE